ncbi:MAG: glycosyltransferase [Chloroflexi bacterium]|nr:glycosyltransferase [Chloroflexota bacterium]
MSLAMPIQNDPRTGRQIEYLAPHYDITVISFGALPPSWRNVTLRPVSLATSNLRHVLEMLLLLLGRLIPTFYEVYFWSRPRYRQCLNHALASKADVYHASDWAMLPIAVRAAQANHAKVVFDIDEYWPLFEESNRLWRLFFAPFVRYIFARYSRFVDAAITVSPAFVTRYQDEYQLDCLLVYNVPEYVEIPAHPIDPDHIRLIHHGAAQPDRLLERLVEAVALLEPRFSLYFLLGDANPGYVNGLKQLADQVAPGRVSFLPTVQYHQVVQTIAHYDIELCYMAPTTYTWLMTLPNKLFESMMAGLGVLVAPSPAMAEVVRQYGSGWVADGFEAPDIAATLNAITLDDLAIKQAAAREAAKTLNAEHELGKVVALYQRLFDDADPAAVVR